MVDISILFGGAATTSTPLVSAYTGFKRYVQNEPQQIATYVKTPTYKADVAYFQSHIGKITSADQLTKDPRLLKFVLTAFNLTADAQYPAKVAAVLNSDLTKTSSMANRLIDPRYRQMAQAFNFNMVGPAQLKNPTVLKDLVSKFTTNGYEQSLSDVNPALRTAAYFLRNIGNVTDTYQILGDSVLRSVVVQALNLPPEIVNQSVEKQKKLIDAKLDIKKFALPSSSAAGGTTKTPLDQATAEQADLLNLRNVVGAAKVSVSTLQLEVANLQTSYQQLATIQNATTGPYAAEIPNQEAAAPVLVEQQGLLAAATDATSTINTNMAKLQQLVQQAGNPSNTTPIADLQAQFTTLYNAITSKIQGADYSNPGTGATENLLDGSTANIVSPAYNSVGDQVSVRSYDLSSTSTFGTQLTAAYNAFTAGSPDLTGAAAALSTAKTVSDVTSQTVNVDQISFTAAIQGETWAGTFDTAQLYKGSQSVYDANLRTITINQLVTKIQDIAQQSSALDPAGDRTMLQSSYNTLLTQLGTAIGTGAAGTDNLLSGTTTQTYNIDNGGTNAARVRSSDLTTSVQGVLGGMDVSSASSANAVMAAITGSIHDAIAQSNTQLKIDGQAINLAATKLDPRSAVDQQYRQLVSSMPDAVKGAAWNGSNLLDPAQKTLSVTSSATKSVIAIGAESTFDADFTQVMTAGSLLLPSDPTDASGAIAKLNDATFNINRILSHLQGELYQIDFAKTLTDNQVKDLQKKADAAVTGSPIKATDFAVQFLKKYLVSVDAQNSGVTASTGNSAYLALFQNAASNFKTSA